jgi:DNA polymerase III epsilon subunit-like protein
MLRSKPLAFIDVETTGLTAGYHEIIEICIITPKYAYHKKIRPIHVDRMDSKAIAINGYKPSEWRHAIEPKIAASEIADLLKGHLIVGHNPRFDMEFITELCWRENVALRMDPRAIDTTTIAYIYLVPMGLHSLALDAIRRFVGWQVREYHDAYHDVLDTQRLYKTLLSPWGRFKIRFYRWLRLWKS